jgi:hypothetical protein
MLEVARASANARSLIDDATILDCQTCDLSEGVQQRQEICTQRGARTPRQDRGTPLGWGGREWWSMAWCRAHVRCVGQAPATRPISRIEHGDIERAQFDTLRKYVEAVGAARDDLARGRHD